MVSAYSCTSVLVALPVFFHEAANHVFILHIDVQFSLWTAGFARGGVGVLACIALNGFMPHHDISGYGMIMIQLVGVPWLG